MGRRIWLLVASTAFFVAARARADEPPPGPIDCSAVERRVAELQQKLAESDRVCKSAESDRDKCSTDLEQTRGREKEKQGEADACKSARADLCAGVGRFADAVAEGSVDPNGVAACVRPEQKARIQGMLDGAKNASRALGQLSSYALGEVDVLPKLGTGKGTLAERQLARLFPRGRGNELLYRRLLVQALRDVAPETLASVAASGPAAVDALFAGGEAIDTRVVPEVQARAATASDQGGGASLIRALRLVQAFQIMGGCAEGVTTGECGLARKLAQLLESRGALVLRQRAEHAWATPCEAIDKGALTAWLSDVPAATRGAGPAGDWNELVDALSNKLFLCYLDASGSGPSYAAWLAERTPRASGPETARAELLATRIDESSDEAICGRAVHALETLAPPAGCAVDAASREALERYAEIATRAHEGDASYALKACDRLVRELFAGNAASIPRRFDAVPPPEAVVRIDPENQATAMSVLRERCAERRGPRESFAEGAIALAGVAAALGEVPSAKPWRVVAAAHATVEEARFAAERNASAFALHAAAREGACDALGMQVDRCVACRDLPANEFHDCAVLGRLERTYRAYTVAAAGAGASMVALVALFVWSIRRRRARRAFGKSVLEPGGQLGRLGLRARVDRLRWLLPSRLGEIEVALPAEPSWERWGDRAVFVRGSRGMRIGEEDVNRAAAAARAASSQVAILVHDDGANPDLAAVRALLDWAARGSSKAVRVMPLSLERLRWSSSPDDLRDLIEEASVHGNPFDIRGRITSSGQFFARERLVSGLLASVQAGQWVVVTGVRRFGKSSLTLEVARRLPGPFSYVDLAGFHHEIAIARDPERAANAVLRHVCSQLALSAQSKFGDGDCPAPPAEGERVDAALLGEFTRALGAWVAARNRGRALPSLVILDEIEQAIGVGAERIGHALEVLAIVIGRLRTALGDESRASGARTGVLLASALHPVLWAPLDVLAHQSLMASFESVSVPAIPDDAAAAMMRALGARQGIRFTDAALELLVAESQGIPLVLRRLGSTVLDLYDSERARQGGLGAVEIGIEGARAAVRREEERGSPVRVWLESEIADAASPVGALLRDLAHVPTRSARALRAKARSLVLEQFATSGVDAKLSVAERERRAEEAASVLVRQLGATGLLVAHGDAIEPESYELPDRMLRRVLSDDAADDAAA